MRGWLFVPSTRMDKQTLRSTKVPTSVGLPNSKQKGTGFIIRKAKNVNVLPDERIRAYAIRLRVWVDPEDGWSSKEDMLTLAKRAQANDMELMVDFHYSDFWADPAHQTIPRAWQNLSFEDLKVAVATHTRDVLLLLKNSGINLAGYRWATKPATVPLGGGTRQH